MKAVCDRSSLSEALAVICASVPSQSTTPVARDVLIQVSETGMNFHSTDLAVFAEVKLLELKESVSGEALIPAERIVGLVREFNTDCVTLEGNDRDFSLNVLSARDKFRIMGHDPGDFPQAPSATDLLPVVVEAEELLEGLKAVSFAVSRDASRAELNGVAFVMEGNKLHFVGTDGNRLAEFALTVSEESERRREGIVPIRAVEAIEKLIGLEPGKVELCLDSESQQLVVVHSRGRVLCRLIKGQIPNYASLIPKEFECNVEVAPRELLQAVRKAAVMTAKEDAIVLLDLGSGGLEVRVDSQDIGSGVVPVENARLSGERLQVRFKVPFLSDGLRALGDSPARLRLRKGKHAAVLDGRRSFRYAFMPIVPKEQEQEE